jgi:hypothetical protein
MHYSIAFASNKITNQYITPVITLLQVHELEHIMSCIENFTEGKRRVSVLEFPTSVRFMEVC